MGHPLPPALAPLTVPRDALRPPRADNDRLGLGMSALAHAALVAALALGVQWRTDSPEGVTAELWAATPQIAAPPREATPTEPSRPQPAEPIRPVPAKPVPPLERPSQRDAEIATDKAERERKEKARREKERQDDEARKKAEAEQRAKDKERAADAQREAARQEQIRRMQAQLGGGPSGNGAPGSTGTAARDAGPSATYAGRIKARIKPNIVLTEDISGNPVTEVEVKVAPDGLILGRRVLKSSGVPAWDEVVLRAIDRTQMLPRDTDGRVPPTMVISFKPQD